MIEEKLKIPKNWVITSVGDIYNVVGGGTPSTSISDYWEGKIPWITSADIHGVRDIKISRYVSEQGIKNSATNKVPPKTLLVVTRVGLGKIAITECEMCFSQDLQGLVQSPDVIWPEYALYYLSYELQKLKFEGRGTTISGVTKKQLKDTQLPLPPLNEQKRIVAKIEELFSELDKGIESLKTAHEQLKVYRQSALKHAFDGKLTAAWRQKHKDKLVTAEQLLESIKRERDNSYQQQLNEWNIAVTVGKKIAKPKAPQPISNLILRELQKLPSLPDGWIWLRYGDLCSVVRNGISQKPEGNEGTKIFRISAVRPMEFITDDVRYIDNSNGQYDEYFLHKGDLVFTRYNGSRSFVGVCAEYKADETHLFPDKLVQTRIAVPSIISGYLEKAVNCGASREFIERLIRTTAGQSGISGSDIKAIPVPICSRAEQIVINDYLNEELSRISEMVLEIETNLYKSEALRQSILKKAFSGNLVAQDPNDEPASVLLEHIRAEKEAQKTESAKTKAMRKSA